MFFNVRRNNTVFGRVIESVDRILKEEIRLEEDESNHFDENGNELKKSDETTQTDEADAINDADENNCWQYYFHRSLQTPIKLFLQMTIPSVLNIRIGYFSAFVFVFNIIEPVVI